MTHVDFPWRILRSIVGGASAIDVPMLYLESVADAELFLESYGYDWNVPHHRLELEALRLDAISFLGGLVSDEASLELPEEIRQEKDVRKVLLWASRDSDEETLRVQQRWSCSLLRVMHTVAHAQTYFNHRFANQIREQILGRFQPHLLGSGPDLRLGNGADAIPLEKFEVKHTKPLVSLVMKLLQKAENVASDVFDRIGVRFVTRERFDILRTVHYLRSNAVIMFANVKPSRSRNTVVDLDWLRVEMDRLDGRIAHGEIEESSRRQRLEALARRGPFPIVTHNTASHPNPFSATNYRAIQFTCRQLIRAREPVRKDDLELLAEAEERLGSTDPLVEKLRERSTRSPEITFFFPFEIQILDHSSFVETRSGRASHADYKARQREVVKLRVLGELLDNHR